VETHFLKQALEARKEQNALRALRIGKGLIDFFSNDYLGSLHDRRNWRPARQKNFPLNPYPMDQRAPACSAGTALTQNYSKKNLPHFMALKQPSFSIQVTMPTWAYSLPLQEGAIPLLPMN
jgi:hypothetical protein